MREISDRECIYKCLVNCEQLAGLDKKQVERIIKERMDGPEFFPNRLLEK